MNKAIEIKEAWYMDSLTATPKKGYGFEFEISGDEQNYTEKYFSYLPDGPWEEVYSNLLFYSESEMNEHIKRFKSQAIAEYERKIKEYTDKLNALK